MRKLLFIIGLLLGFVSYCEATPTPTPTPYTYVSITATACIGDGSGSLLASGTMTIVGTDGNDNAIPYRVGSATQAITSPITRTITSGTLASLQLGNPLMTMPLNIYYRFTIQDNITKRMTLYKLVNVNDAGTGTWNWCNYSPSSGVTIPYPSATPPTVCANLTDSAPSCHIDMTNLSNAASGHIPTALFLTPTITTYTSSSGTYTTPANTAFLVVEIVGGGGGAAGDGAGASCGATGGTSTFGSYSALGGTCEGSPGGGTSGGCDKSIVGQAGAEYAVSATVGADGGNSYFGGGGRRQGSGTAGNGGNGLSNSGGGGGSGAETTSGFIGGSGAAGGYCYKIITSPSSTYSYAVGSGGSGGAGTSGGHTGGNGGSGIVIITAYPQ